MKSAAKNKVPLTDSACAALLRSLGQENLLKCWDTLDFSQKEFFKRQVGELDTHLLLRLKEYHHSTSQPSISPFTAYSKAGHEDAQKIGRNLLQQGKVALLVLAGGQGSRLRFEGPKGMFPITRFKKKSLFQLLAEKVREASAQAGRPLEVAIMTSPLNHEETQNFFIQHDYFGLNSFQMSFFSQNMWPLLDFKGQLFLEEPGKIAFGPNGNGQVFCELVAAGIWKKWNTQGIQSVNIVPIDNLLADPFDPELCGWQHIKQADVVVKATLKKHPHENVGILAQVNGKTAVIEYSEMSLEAKTEQDPFGNLVYGIANLSLFNLSMPFIHQASQIELPLHRAMKSVKALDDKGHTIFHESPNAWKFETFIFDVLPYASHVEALLYQRSQCFAPLKNLKGEDSIETVQAALLNFDRQVFETISGTKVPADAVFELAPGFYYPTPELIQRWRGKTLPNKEYIDV